MHDFSHGDLFCDGRERVGSVAGFKNVVFLSVFGVVRGLVSFLVSLVSGSSSTSSPILASSVFWFLLSQFFVFWPSLLSLSSFSEETLLSEPMSDSASQLHCVFRSRSRCVWVLFVSLD